MSEAMGGGSRPQSREPSAMTGLGDSRRLSALSATGGAAGGGGGVSGTPAGRRLDPGPPAPPPGRGSAPPSEKGEEAENIAQQVDEIKRRALLRLTLAGSRAGNKLAPPPTMTPAEYAHRYRTGECLALNTPNIMHGFAGRPDEYQGSQYAQPNYSDASSRPRWPPPPPDVQYQPYHQHGDPGNPGLQPAQHPILGTPVGQSPRRFSNWEQQQQHQPAYASPQYGGPGAPGGGRGPAEYAESGKNIRWKRVVERDQNGELVESVKWIREE
eukprot:gene18523-28590_t